MRLPTGCLLDPAEATTILLPREAHGALAAKAYGLIARGSEGGGGLASLGPTFQLLLSDPAITVPVWTAGGMGHHSAAASIAGGAAGVLLDAQLALLRESVVPKDIAATISAMDGRW